MHVRENMRPYKRIQVDVISA